MSWSRTYLMCMSLCVWEREREREREHFLCVCVRSCRVVIYIPTHNDPPPPQLTDPHSTTLPQSDLFCLFFSLPLQTKMANTHFADWSYPSPAVVTSFFILFFFFYFTSGFLTQVLKKLKQEIFSRFILDGTGDSSSPSTPNPPSVWFKSQPVDFITILLLYHWSVERHQWLFTRKPMEIRKTKNQLNIFLLLTFWNPNPVFEFLGGNNKILHFFSPPSPVVL